MKKLPTADNSNNFASHLEAMLAKGPSSQMVQKRPAPM